MQSIHTIIIGSGFAGIGMAVALKKAGLGDFLILEKQHDVGGVWRDNTYPGAACDVPSHLYSFSFEPNPNWSKVFAPQAEIHQYLKHCAHKYGLLPFIRFGCEVAQAAYHEGLALWHVTLTNGQVLQARFLVTATGQLSRPVYPKLEGMESFTGHVCHSAHWDHGYDMKGKRVAVIGTGASAIQFVPAIAGQVRELTVFQRSAAYILPRPDGPYAGWRKALFRMAPWTMKLHRARIYSQYETRVIGFNGVKAVMALAGGLPFKALLRRQVPDPDLRARLTPDYAIGCKRILLSNDYLATMAKPHVKLVTQGIRRITADGIETTDGQHHTVDAIVYGTGFAATEFLAPMTITGRHGVALNEAWRKGAQAYLGMTVPGFPNFFMLYGPNTNLGHSSIIYMLESQIAHALRCMKAAHQAGASAIEVDAARNARFNGQLQARLAKTVWQGCKSWYVDANGHNSTNWPGFTFGYRWLTRYSSLNAYTLHAKKMKSRRYPDTSHVRLRAIKSTFTAEGALCGATLYVPEDTRPDQELPAILMLGGWGSIQRAMTSSFTHSFVEAGFAVMEFDYPGWGDSGGFPRQGINPWRRTRVADTALAHLKSQPMVAAHQITLWGTSFGGGHVVDLASKHPELKGAIIQVPMLDGLAAAFATPSLRLLKLTMLGLLDQIKPGAPIYVPTLAREGEFGTMDRDGAWDAMENALAAWPGHTYDNRVAARSVLTMPLYRPWLRLKDVKIPMLMIGATGDTVAPFVSEKVRRVGNPNVQVIQIDANHFDPYFDPLFPRVLAHQLKFLRR